MACAAGGLTLAAAAVALSAAAPAPLADPVRALAGHYGRADDHVEIVPLDAAHALVRIYYLFGLDGDKECDFEEVATAEGDTLAYRRPPAGDEGGCALTVRRRGGVLAWSASMCDSAKYCAPGHALGAGTSDWAHRRALRADEIGVAMRGATVSAWRHRSTEP